MALRIRPVGRQFGRKFDHYRRPILTPLIDGVERSGCLDAVADLGNLWREMNAEELAQINDSDHVSENRRSGPIADSCTAQELRGDTTAIHDLNGKRALSHSAASTERFNFSFNMGFASHASAENSQ